MVSIGGTIQYNNIYNLVAANDIATLEFASNVATFLKQFSFDGVELVWNMFEGPNDKNNFIKLLQVVKKNISNDMILTASISTDPTHIQEFYNVSAMFQYLDFVNIIAESPVDQQVR